MKFKKTMKVLWITNIVFPEAQELLKGSGSLKASGGWMIGAANALAEKDSVQLYIATVCADVRQLTKLQGRRIVYYLLPYGKGNDKYNRQYEPLWKRVNEEVHPDVVHIHGTEFTHGLAYVRACGAERIVVSIQGLVSVYSRYYYSGLSKWQIFKSFTLRSFLGRNTFSGQRSFEKRGEYERDLLSSVDHIIGRTSWDRAHAWAINPQAQYHYVGETLRSPFYEGKWDYKKCTIHSIFLSQANYSVKGLHMVLQAMPYILRHYSDAKIVIAGNDITHKGTLRDILQYTDYGSVIRERIKKLSLEEAVSFTGPLDAEGMKREYLKANVFVCPSTIENSPNSLGEAQILGVPIVAAYVGGIPDMMKGDEEHLYRFEEVEMMAKKICDLFAAKGELSYTNKMQEFARTRHDAQSNCNDLMNVYMTISGIII